jgi:hypothetical protein
MLALRAKIRVYGLEFRATITVLVSLHSTDDLRVS